MEASGLGGPMLGLVLLPGLLAAGLGSLIFIGLGTWTGLGTFSLEVPDIPGFAEPNLAQFGWAIVIGLIASALGSGVRWLALRVRPFVEPRPLVAVPLAGLVVAALAIGFAAATGHAASEVLFSGQDALGGLLTDSARYSVGTLLLLIGAKALAYTVSLAAFRGGPIFPAMFLGAALGMVMSHLPGLPLVAGAAMGIGAMSVADAALAAHVGPAGEPPAGLRRGRPDAARDRRGRGRPRGHGPSHTRPAGPHIRPGRCRATARRCRPMICASP